MFYDYYAFNPPNESTKDKFISSTTVYRKKHFGWYRNRQKALKCNFKPRNVAKEIPHQAVMELFDMHHNRTAQKYFEEFFPLYPKSSSLLVSKHKVSHSSESILENWLSRNSNAKAHNRLLTKIFIGCDFELEVFNELNNMNESPMIKEAPQQDLRKDKLTEDLLLYLTNIRLRDVLKLKKHSYEVWTEEYRKNIETISEEAVDGIEELFVPEMFKSSSDTDDEISSSSNTDDDISGSSY